ncbi:MAG TPA: response regulator [Chitinispirillaceae bacterium]|nr:response regulator [Chitinispirillaceae bacterium]
MDNKVTILIIDDDAGIRESLSLIIKTMGFTVKAVDNGFDALTLFSQQKFDLVVLDVIMPEMDGWEVLKYIRDDPLLQSTKVMLLTAKSTEKDRLIGKKILKADEYISKPFDLNEFKDTIRKLLGIN